MKEKLIHFLKDLNIKMNNELLSLDVVEYVEKIKEHASIISVHNNDSLVAFIAYYDNDPNFDFAFLSMLAVCNDFKGMGYGKSLLEISIRKIEKKGFKRYGLEVKKNNFDAIKLYEKYGFVFKEKRKNGFIYMEKKCKL